MRVLQVIPFGSIGGAQTHLADLAEGLSGRGVSVSVASGTDGPMAARLRTAGIAVNLIPMRRRTDLRAVRALEVVMHRHQIDLVHTHSPLAGVLGRHAALRAGCPVVHTMHGLGVLDEFDQTQAMWHRLKLRSYIWHERWLNWRSDAIVCLTPGLAANAIGSGHVRTSRVAVIPSGVVVPEGVNRNGGQPLVAYIGRLHLEKGIDALIPTLAHVRRAVPNAVLRIVGDGPHGLRLHQRLEESGLDGAVEWMGATEDVDQALAGVCCVMLPSRVEGLSYVALEAMARAVPCVATSVGGMPDLIVHERTGLLVPPKDPRSLADAVVRILQDPAMRARLGGAARQEIAARFSRETMIERTLDLYDTVLARRR